MMTENFIWDDQLLLQKFIEQYLFFFFFFSIRESSTYPGGLKQTKMGSMGQKIVVYVRVTRMGAFLLYYRRGVR